MLPALAEANLAMVSSSNTLASLTVGDDSLNPTRQFPNYFRLVGSDAQQGVFLAEQALALGYTTAAVVSETKAVSKGLADVFASAFTANGGTVTVTHGVPDGATDFADFIAAAGDPDVIFFGGEYPVAATLATQVTAAGLTVPVMGGDGIKDDAFITQARPRWCTGRFGGVPADELTSADEYFAAYGGGVMSPSPTAYAYDAAVPSSRWRRLRGAPHPRMPPRWWRR
jgi:branched-chain amino acid transport system substrate-binding protein